MTCVLTKQVFSVIYKERILEQEISLLPFVTRGVFCTLAGQE